MLGFPRVGPVGPVGPGWPDAAAAGGASWSLPPPSGTVGPVVPHSTSGLLGRGTEQPVSPPLPQPPVSGQKLLRRSAERSAPKPEPGEGAGAVGVAGWVLESRSRGAEDSGSGLSGEETRRPDSPIPG